MTLVSHIPPLERKRESQNFHCSKTYILECQDRGSSHRAEDLRCRYVLSDRFKEAYNSLHAPYKIQR